jgi:cell division protein FtsL
MKLTYFLYTYIFLHIFGYTLNTLYVNAILKINNFFLFLYIYYIICALGVCINYV